MSIVTAAVAENPVLDATVLDFNTAERIAPLESTTRLPPQVALRFAQSESLAEFLARPSENKNAGFDMIYVPTGQSSQLNDRILRRSFEGLEDLNVIIEKDAAADKLIHHLTSTFHFVEIVPPLLSLQIPPAPSSWYGCRLAREKVIVSLTTIRDRAASVHKVIESVKFQSLRPDAIVLNISEEPYLLDKGIPRSEVPENLLRLEKQGFISINYVKNIGPYRKLLPVLERFWDANCLIVTCDDDTLYPEHWLRGLVQSYLIHRTIVAYRCSYMRLHDGRPLPYLQWVEPPTGREADENYLSRVRFATGKDGVLYAPRFFPPEIFDPELIALAPTADDLAFKLATMTTKTPVNKVPTWAAGSGDIPEFAHVAKYSQKLWDINLQKKRRDTHAIAAIFHRQKSA